MALLGAAAVGAFLLEDRLPAVVVDPSPLAPVTNASPEPSGEPGPRSRPSPGARLDPADVRGRRRRTRRASQRDGGFVAVGGRVFRDIRTPSGGTASAWHSDDGLAWSAGHRPGRDDSPSATASPSTTSQRPASSTWPGPAWRVAVGASHVADRERRCLALARRRELVPRQLPRRRTGPPGGRGLDEWGIVVVGVVEDEGAPRGAAWISDDGRFWERVPDGDAFDIGGYITLPSGYATGGPVDVVVLPDGTFLAPSRTCTATADMEEQPVCQWFVTTSRDGTTWEREGLPGEMRLGSVAAAGDRVVALTGTDEGGSVLVMVPGSGWLAPRRAPGRAGLARVIAYGDGFPRRLACRRRGLALLVGRRRDVDRPARHSTADRRRHPPDRG